MLKPLKPIFSVLGPLKINISYPWTTENQYILSSDHLKSIYFVLRPLKIIMINPQTTKNQYLRSPSY